MPSLLARLRGSPIVTDLEPYQLRAHEIKLRVLELAPASDEEIRDLSKKLRSQALEGGPLEELEVEAFALVHQASHRTLRLRPFDVQVLAALAMNRGNIVEMQTGEGKTLAAVFAVYLNALSGHGVHVLTFNDYLARRDAAWMGPIYNLLGLSVGAVQEGMGPAPRRQAYSCDLTYLTAKEAGFDLLRGCRCQQSEELVQRPFHFAVVDEADSLLIDEGRVPLVLAGSRERVESSSYRMADIVRHLESGIHYEFDEYRRNVDLTSAGRERAEELLGCGSLLTNENLTLLTELNCALHAAHLLELDIDYILRDGRIQLVDDFTGRVVEDRRWPDGLQAALEAKEGLELRPEGRVLGSMTLQHFLRLYPRLCGMTGTAQPAAEEIKEFYGPDVVVIPPNRPCIRRDLPDVIFSHQEAKMRALADEIRQVHASGRPILVGTLSVAESESLAAALLAAGVPCEVLNAKRDEREAGIIAKAGELGAVTISTNMAGRGTDIRLGGPRVVELGGLYVIGTNRHESIRIDQQLRGRAGRQGDPGSSRFFISLEDELVVRYGIERLIPRRHWPAGQRTPLDNPVIRREIARAQRIIEGQNFEIRRTLLNYSEQIEKQRKIIDRRRRELLLDRTTVSLFAASEPQLHAERCADSGEEAVRLAEKQAALFHIDKRWSDHLGAIADLREGIHLVSVGGRHPLTEFLHEVVDRFHEMQRGIDGDLLETMRTAKITEAGIDLEGEGLKRPSSTWTYIISDDPFRNQLGIQLAGDVGFAAAAAALYNAPLLILWGLYNRYFRKSRPG